MAEARDIHVSLAQIPQVADSVDKGMFVDLLKEMQKVYKGGKITWGVYPFKRSMANVASGAADLHMPMLKDPEVPEKVLPFDLSQKPFLHAWFLLYSHKDRKDISPDLIRKGGKKFSLETDAAHVSYFHGTKVVPTSCIRCALKKVNDKRLDGLIFAAKSTDEELAKLGLKDIKRSPYHNFGVHYVLPKGAKGKEVDQIFQKLLAKVKKNRSYDSALKPWLSYHHKVDQEMKH